MGIKMALQVSKTHNLILTELVEQALLEKRQFIQRYEKPLPFQNVTHNQKIEEYRFDIEQLEIILSRLNKQSRYGKSGKYIPE